MVNRVSTVGNYSAILANLMAASQRQVDAGNRVATQKNGKDLKDFARNDEMLTGMLSTQTRLTTYQEQNGFIADKLTTQNTALNQIADAADATRQAIADALASGRADTLMQDLQGHMRDAVAGMNTTYGGNYIFAGGQIGTAPVTATALTDLTAGPPIASFFQNDQFKTQAKLDDSATVKTGMLASDLGTPMLTAYQTLEAFNEGGSGPIAGALTAAQKTFLQGQLTAWDTLHSDLTNVTGQNGIVQQRVDAAAKDLTNRQDTLSGMLGGITDADMAKAATDLQMAQMSVQAAAQVFQSLQQSSLLNFLK